MTALHGVYDMPADEYHARLELSSSGARRLLPPHTPAQFAYERVHGRTATEEMTFGSAVHTLVLGAGAEVVPLDFRDWKTNAAKDARAALAADGKIPLLRKDYERAEAMSIAVHEHPLAAALLRSGKPEQALFWQDAETGVQCRALVDWMDIRRGRLIAVDLKTCSSADPDKIAKAVYEYGYHLQAAFYLDGIKTLELGERPAMTFVFLEKQPPYLVNVVQLDHLALEAGAFYVRKAIRTFRDCTASGEWPGYRIDDIERIELPAYAQNLYFQESGR